MRYLIFIIIFLISPDQSDSQTVWTQQNSGTNDQLYAISFYDENHGYLSGRNAIIYYTSNGGTSWSPVYSSPVTNDRIECIIYKSLNRVIAGSYNSIVYRTTDAGINWTYQTISPPCRIHGMSFINENTGWLVGEIHAIHGYVYRKTTNGGETWYEPSAQYTFYDNNLFDIEFVNENTGFVCGANPDRAIIAKTTNGGSSWIKTEFPERYYWGNLNFLNENTGWVFGAYYGSKLLQTTNGGDNWNLIYSDTTTFLVNDFHFADQYIGYYLSGSLQKTTNSGANWFYTPIPNNPGSLESIYFLNSQTGFICGYNGSVYKTTNGGLTNFSNMNDIYPDKFSLSQNYPNPFNPVTVIRYSLSENRFVTLKLYDVRGNEIATLINERQSSGTYNYQLSTVNYQLSSGVYFYRLEAGEFVETNRMILMK